MEHGSRTRLLSGIVILAVFGAGLLVGFAADTRLSAEGASVVTEAVEAPVDAVADRSGERPRGTRLTRQLDPTPTQLDQIEAIVAEHRERTNALDKEMRATFQQGFREILLQTREAIKGVFSAEKAAEYQRLLDEWDAEQEAERESRDRRK